MNPHPIKILKRCKSVDNVTKSFTETKSDDFLNNDSGLDGGYERSELVDHLEMKIDRIADLFHEQCRLLAEIRDEIHESKQLIETSERAQDSFIAEVLKKSSERSEASKELEPSDPTDCDREDSRARSFLDAIETKQAFCLERELRDALVSCLQSEELKSRMVRDTVAGTRDMVRDTLSRDTCLVYVPLLQRATRRLTRRLAGVLEDCFAELEANSSQQTSSICRMTRALKRALDRQTLVASSHETSHSHLRTIVEDILQKEMQDWRQMALDTFCCNSSGDSDVTTEWIERGATPPPLEYPDSPQQPADPDSSIIDQLMNTAEINKQIQDGDVDGAFSRALSAADLSLVMAACRAADSATAFEPCRLQQSTLLSLAQQLPTDMVHDTQLKCRYLEEALINLNPEHSVTRAHLPLVVREIRNHLTKFLSKFPSHFAGRRITLIVMAADNLLK